MAYQLAVTIDNALRFRFDSEFIVRFPAVVRQIKADTKIANPERLEALRLGRRPFGIAPWINCFEWDPATQTLSLPRGYMTRLGELFQQGGIEAVVTPGWVTYEVDMPEPLVPLRDYQKPALVEMAGRTQGILEAPPGSGKTVIGLHLVARQKQRALWLTHTMDLAAQTTERAEQVLGIPQSAIGLIGAGKEWLGELLTIGIVQTLAKRDLSPWAHLFGTVILDESHHCPAEIFKSVVHAFPALNRYGLSGSMQRQDKLESIAHLYLGPTLHTIRREDGGTITPTLRVISTSYTVPAWEHHLKLQAAYEDRVAQATAAGQDTKRLRRPIPNVTKIISELLEHPDRNAMIAQTIVDSYRGHSTLVITGRVEHCYTLAELIGKLDPDCRCAVIHGGLGSKLRQAIIEAMRAGELDVLLSVQIAKEGLDIPRLDQEFLLAGGRSQTGVKQQVGRIQRTFPGKVSASVIDVVDEAIGVLKAQHSARRRVYRELGMDVGRQRRTA